MSFEIYGDGSCNPSLNIGAWVALIIIDKNQYEIAGIVKNTTNQAMELQALLSALNFLDNMSILSLISVPLIIYTDSQYVCHLPSRRSKLERNNFLTKKNSRLHNYKLIQCLYHYCDIYQLEFIKIKAHQKKGQSLESDRLRMVDKKARSMVRQAGFQHKK